MFQGERTNSGSKRDKIILNVGGKRFEPYRSTLRNQPDMALAWIMHNKDKLDYDPETGEFFFDRHPRVFSQILNYFQTGKLHCPRGMCGPCFQDELTFWGIHEQQMESCCWSDYTNYREAQENLKALDLQPKFTIDSNRKDDGILYGNSSSHVDEPTSFWDTYKPVVWEILDEPYSSTVAKVYGWISLIFVVVSIFTAALWTVSLFQDEETFRENPGDPRLFLIVVEGICTVWFSCEFILRLALCPSLKTFTLNYQNWLDLVAIIPAYFIILGARNLIIDALTTLRILRIFRFGKLLYDLQIIGKTFKASWNLFLILLFLLFIPVLVCSSVLFYTERNHGEPTSKSNFTSIPASLWWGLVTVTTVGYGDVRPTSFPGKIFGVFCALCGVLLVAMSTSITGNSFALYYNLARTQMKLPRERRKLSIDCENLPTIISQDSRSYLSGSPEDSGCERSLSCSIGKGSKSYSEINADEAQSLQGNNNNVFVILDPSYKQSFEEGYIDLVKETVIHDKKV